MKETENKAKMLTFEKGISSRKEYFTILSSKWYENEFLWFIWTDMNQKKPTIASTTSELSDGLRKNNSFMPKYIEKCAQTVCLTTAHLSSKATSIF